VTRRILFHGKSVRSSHSNYSLLRIVIVCSEGMVHDLWVERELRTAAAEPTFVSRDGGCPESVPAPISIPVQLLIAWVFVPAWSLWQAFGQQGIENIEEGLAFPPLATVSSPILLLSLLTALVASTMSLLSKIFLPETIRNTPPDERAVRKVQQTSRTKARIAYLLQMASCVLYQATVACTWVLDRSFSIFDLAPLVYMFAVTGIMWSTLVLTPYHNASV